MNAVTHRASSLAFFSFAAVFAAFALAAANPASAEPFPIEGLLPKREIRALEFIERHPTYDGRGVIVAVFDTGVDPGAAGLQRTSDGRPKIVDMIDATGSGDVQLSAAQADEDGQLTGRTGRKLTLPDGWLDPDRPIRVGLKRAYDFFPGRLIARMKRERREAFDQLHTEIERELRTSIAAWERTHPRPNEEQREHGEELRTRLAQLEFAHDHFDDPGPLLDCVAFHDGARWRAAIDTDEDGDLRDEKLLTNFRAERQYGTFANGAALNFAINIEESGERLSIVVDSGEHGTHVASIIAGFHADSPQRNGVAPGARIVSVKIGDPRLGSMETAESIARGLAAAVRNHCDAINMSYGEPTHSPNRGWLTELITETVDKHNIAFVASAGNSGPALSTVGSPGGTTSAVIGVGAYVSPAMMAAEHAIRTKLPEMAYTFTSLGPTWDGDLGVDLFAPGGAVAAVPRWTEQRSMQMSGTSMASPNACGAVALLISGLKQQARPWSPYALRRAMQNTARPVSAAGPFAQGAGLVQVDRAFDELTREPRRIEDTWKTEVRVQDGRNERGIYLREPHETLSVRSFRCSVRLTAPHGTDNASKSNLDRLLHLTTTQSWVEVSPHLPLTYGTHRFQVEVDPTRLEPGVHFAEVLAHDDVEFHQDDHARPLFRLPVTVIAPEQPTHAGRVARASFSLAAGQANRQFIAVPHGATWVDVRLRREPTSEADKPAAGQRRKEAGTAKTNGGHSASDEGPASLVLHAVERRDGRSFEAREWKRYASLSPGESFVDSFAVDGRGTLELCVAQNWSSAPSTHWQCELHFHGLEPTDRAVVWSSDEPGTWQEVTATVARETLAPAASLATHRHRLRPSKSSVEPVSGLDATMPDTKPLYELQLDYAIDQANAGTATFRFPAIDELLYESALGSTFWTLTDEAGREVAHDDAWPDAKRLDKGSHSLRMRVVSTDAARLEAMRDLELCVDRPIGRTISITAYPDRLSASRGDASMRTESLEIGQQRGFFLATPNAVRSSTEWSAGDELLGEIRYGKSDSSRFGSQHRPEAYPLRISISAANNAASEKSTTSKPTGAKKSPKQQLDDAVFDAKLRVLEARAAARDERGFEQIAAELLEQRPRHLPVLVARLKLLDDEQHRKEHLPRVVEAADAVLKQLNTRQLAQYFGVRHDPESAAEREMHESMTEQRATLIDTLYRKGRALGYMELPDVVAKHPIRDQAALDAAFEANFRELAQWVDTTEQQYVLLHIRAERRQQRYGEAIALLNRYLPHSAPNYWYYKKRRDLYEQLGWEHLHAAESRWLVIRFPNAKQP